MSWELHRTQTPSKLVPGVTWIDACNERRYSAFDLVYSNGDDRYIVAVWVRSDERGATHVKLWGYRPNPEFAFDPECPHYLPVSLLVRMGQDIEANVMLHAPPPPLPQPENAA